MGLVLFLVVIGFLLAGGGLAYIIGALGVMIFWLTDKGEFLSILPQRIFSQVDSFTLMSMPLFMLVGEVMNRGGSTKALINFSMSLVGRFKGGLGHVNILTSVFFAGVSGSAAADAAALTTALVPEMRKQGYTNTYAGAITAASAIIGPIIPPSIVMIMYGGLMKTSIGGLFAAGFVPGLLLALVLMIANAFFAHKDGHPGGKGTEIPKFLVSLKAGLPALTLPFIILGGIVFGIVTPTEGAALAVVAAMAAGFLYRELSWKSFYESVKSTVITSGMIFMVMASAACAAYIASLEKWPQLLAEFALNSGLTGVPFLLLVNLVFFIAGMFMNVPMALFLLVPLFGPALILQGFEPIHLGIVLCFNLSLGMITPPFGAVLIIVSSVSGENYWKLAWATLPFVILEVLLLVAISVFPEMILFVPRMLGYL